MDNEQNDRDNGHANGRLKAPDALRAAREILEATTGRPPETVSGMSRADEGGWTIALDVVELSRVPPSTDVLATYEVTIDARGDLDDLQRVRRYTRNQANEE